MNHARTLQLIRDRLAPLAPLAVELVDDSARHAGHAGAREGGHFNLTVVSAAFSGKTRLDSQRLVLSLIGDLNDAGIHALSITARSPESVPPSHPH